MKRISIQDLKARLSAALAQLSPAQPSSVHRGKDVGRGRLKPALDQGTKGRYLAVLLEDRNDR